MKKLLVMVILIGLVLSLPLFTMGEDSKEVLILKRDLLQERVMRIQAQLTLMQQQFKDGQEFLQKTQQELEEINKKLKVMESKKEEIPKPMEKKK